MPQVVALAVPKDGHEPNRPFGPAGEAMPVSDPRRPPPPDHLNIPLSARPRTWANQGRGTYRTAAGVVGRR